MDFIYVGKIVNTHALQGEMRILSSFDYKDTIYQKDIPFYIGNAHEKHLLKSFRKHKQYDLLTFQDINHIEKATLYKGKNLYITKDVLAPTQYVVEDFIDLDVYEKNTYIGKIITVEENKANKIFLLDNQIRIPYVPAYIKKIDIKNKKIEVERVKGFLDEIRYNHSISRTI